MKVLISLLAIFVMSICEVAANDGQKLQSQIPLAQQYQNLSATCETIDGFRTLKLYKMDQFWKAVLDSIKTQRGLASAAIFTVNQKELKIKALQTSLLVTKNKMEELENNLNSITFLGIGFSKDGFTFFASITILILVVISIAMFFVSKASYKSYKEEKNLHELMYNEFENYKHAAIEKQMKLSRELQDYRNRWNEMKRTA